MAMEQAAESTTTVSAARCGACQSNHGVQLTASSVRFCAGLPLPCFFHVYGYRPLNRHGR